jgi:type II restriction enzyme
MTQEKVISSTAAPRRAKWIDEIITISGNFGQDNSRIEEALNDEIKKDGSIALLDHLHLCGAIPEYYGHDSSEEKLYSKYTDALLAASFRYLGLTSCVLAERADAADVEAVTETQSYSLVGDAKVFRLSRTAKNQKDFKIEAMHGWKRDNSHAMVICPIYQLPTRSSQIFQQAISRNVCIFTYSHLAVLVRFVDKVGKKQAEDLLFEILKCTEALNPTKEALTYWQCLNRTILHAHNEINALWGIEKLANLEAISLAKAEALMCLSQERKKIMLMSREEAIKRLIKDRNIEGKTQAINNVKDNNIFTFS